MADVEIKSALVRTKPAYVHALSLLILLPALALVPRVVAGGLGGALSFFAVYFAALMGTIALGQRVWHRERRTVGASGEGLRLDGRLVARRDALRSSRIVRRGEECAVRFDRDWRPIEIVVACEDEGHTLLAALQLDASRSLAPFAFHAGTPTKAYARLFAALAIFVTEFTLMFEGGRFFGDAAIEIALLLPLVLMAVCYAALGPFYARVVVGADGLRVRYDFGREHFIAFAALERVDVDDCQVTLRLRGRAPMTLTLGGHRRFRYLLSLGRNNFGEGSEVVGAFARRVEACMQAHVASCTIDSTSLRRAGRSTEEWIGDLLVLIDRDASYRWPAPSTDVLWRVLEDPSRAPTERIGAAIALRRSMNDADRAKVLAVAEACAAPRVRVALCAAGGGSEERLAEALGDVDDEEAWPSPSIEAERK